MRISKDERGLTLMETMASLTVFAIITVGITPLLASSLRGSALSRSGTIAKDVALQSMERLRGLPFYIAYQSQTKKVDLLDMYFPCADPALDPLKGCTGEGTRSYNSATGTFTVTCGSSTTVGPSCAVPIPSGYSVSYATRFVRGDGTTLESPLSTYKRNPGTSEGALDTPPSQLVDVTVTARWTFGGAPQTYVLRSLLGDRKFGPIKMAALGRVAYGVQAQTGFQHTAGDAAFSDLTGTAGNTESRSQTRLVSSARQSVRGSEITLIRRPESTETEGAHLTGSPLLGVVTDLSAPPTQVQAPNPKTGAGGTLSHPNLSANDQIAFSSTTESENVSLGVTTGLPAAAGGFEFQAASGDITGLGYFWMHNQADPLQNELLKLDLTKKVFSLKSQSSLQMSGSSSVNTTPVGIGREVRAKANLDIELIRAMPVVYLPGAEDERHVLIIKDFTARLDCKAAGDTVNSSVITAEWSATFKMWRDSVNNGTSVDPVTGANEIVPTNVTLSSAVSSATGTTSVRTLLTTQGIPGGNPLIYDGLTPADDVYLFQDGLTNGYLADFTFHPITSAEELQGDLVRASVDGAINIQTVPTNVLFPDSGLQISVGSMSCEALDQR